MKKQRNLLYEIGCTRIELSAEIRTATSKCENTVIKGLFSRIFQISPREEEIKHLLRRCSDRRWFQ